MANSVVFARLMEEHGNLETEPDQGDQLLGARRKRMDNKDAKFDEPELKKADTALMQIEERNTGAITWSIYHKYLRFAGSVLWAPFLLLLLTLSQVAQGMSSHFCLKQTQISHVDLVGNNLFLGFWTSSSIPGLTQGGYMAIYASLGENSIPLHLCLSVFELTNIF
jgi:ATP-binding cassette, subfamily C (CFTR/MRP), member 1